ncbi:MAG: hypothetical protein ACREQK_17680, partial [Candidatus Binatia bacterium]
AFEHVQGAEILMDLSEFDQDNFPLRPAMKCRSLVSYNKTSRQATEMRLVYRRECAGWRKN